jgi:hypothetical protein
MVGRTKPDAAVAVVFHRAGEPDDRRVAVNGEEAIFLLMRIVGALDELQPGDSITIEAPDGAPETSRASHYS